MTVVGSVSLVDNVLFLFYFILFDILLFAVTLK